MTSKKTFDYVTDYLAEKIESDYASQSKDGSKKTLKYYGYGHKKLLRSIIAMLCQFFRVNICGASKPIIVVDDQENAYAYNGEYYDCVGSAVKFLTEVVERVLIKLKVAEMYIFDAPVLIAPKIARTLTSSEELLFKPNRRYIAFNNGVFDLKDGRLKNFDTRYATDLVFGVDYLDKPELERVLINKYGSFSKNNPMELWDSKISQIIPNKEMRDAFQQFCGSLLVDRDQYKIEYVCYLIGSGGNGKSVLASVIAGVFGDRYFSRFTPKQLFRDSDARVNIAALQGKVANLVGDLDDKDISGGDFKRFASGEKFQGRRNYKDPILVTAPPLLCCTNAMPETSDDSWGFHRRQLPIYTTAKQWRGEDCDPQLTAKLTTDEARQVVFLWIYEGYKKIIRNGGEIKLGEEVLEAQRMLMENSNSVRRWWVQSDWLVAASDDENNGFWKWLYELDGEYHQYCVERPDNEMKGGRGSVVAQLLRSNKAQERKLNGRSQFWIKRKMPENN